MTHLEMGHVSVDIITIEKYNSSHQFILINGSLEKIASNTIICNIMRGEVYCGDQAKKYIKEFARL